MESFAEKISHIEKQITTNIDLLEIAKGYCEYNFDKSSEISALGAILSIILEEQKELAQCFDCIL